MDLAAAAAVRSRRGSARDLFWRRIIGRRERDQDGVEGKAWNPAGSLELGRVGIVVEWWAGLEM